MAASSVETSAQIDLQTILAAAGMTGMTAFNIREVPTITEVIDNLPLVLICGRKEQTGGLGFEGAVGRAYVEEIIVIGGSEGDLETDQPTVQQWKEQAADAVERNSDGSWRTKLPNTPSVYDIRVESEIKGIEPTKLAKGYAYLSFFVTVSSSE